jgi:hypothetical protein
VRVHAPADVVAAIDERSSFVNVGSDTPLMLAFWLAMIDEDFEAQDHPELGGRAARACGALPARGRAVSAAQRSSPRAITIRWMSEVPSSISSSLASRIHFSTGYSRE